MGCLRVVTQNVRYGSADDGKFSWPYRRPFLAQVLKEADGDIVCLQEPQAWQIKEILSDVPGYHCFGLARDDGIGEGEHSAILVRDRIVIESGTFWLSNEPHKVGSVGWGAKHRRVCSWVRLDGGLRIFNVHLDNEVEEARYQGMQLILKRILQDSAPTLLCGDFNAEPAERCVRSAIESGAVDFAAGTGPTFHGYGTSGERIDYVLGWGEWNCVSAQVLRRPNQDFPSDHWPVLVELKSSLV